MSATAALETPATNNTPAADPSAAMTTLTDAATGLTKTLADLNTRLNTGPTPGQVFGGKAPYGTTGPVGQDRPYSYTKAIAAKRGLISPDKAKFEIHCHDQLRKFYNGGPIGSHFGVGGMLVPIGVDYLPTDNDEQETLVGELRQRFDEDRTKMLDPDEMGYVKKALGTVDNTAGGPLAGFPAMGELIDMQRNLEVFSRAGASQVPLGPNGQMYYPKLISGATAYWVNENPAAAVTASQQTTGNLNLNAKTLAVRVPVSNQLLKFNLVSAEAMVRLDMARVAALKVDSSSFDGAGGTSIKGLLTYDRQTTWASGTDKLIGVTATTTGANGDTLNGVDLYKMNGALPDQVGDDLCWVFRKSYWWERIATARAGTAAVGDGGGNFMHSMMRAIEQGVASNRFLGNRLILSSNCPATRVKGSGTALTCAMLGYFPDWLIGRAGVAEIDANPYSDTAWGNIQTELRLVEFVDAGPRHAASFAVCDYLLTTAFTA